MTEQEMNEVLAYAKKGKVTAHKSTDHQMDRNNGILAEIYAVEIETPHLNNNTTICQDKAEAIDVIDREIVKANDLDKPKSKKK